MSSSFQRPRRQLTTQRCPSQPALPFRRWQHAAPHLTVRSAKSLLHLMWHTCKYSSRVPVSARLRIARAPFASSYTFDSLCHHRCSRQRHTQAGATCVWVKLLMLDVLCVALKFHDKKAWHPHGTSFAMFCQCLRAGMKGAQASNAPCKVVLTNDDGPDSPFFDKFVAHVRQQLG